MQNEYLDPRAPEISIGDKVTIYCNTIFGSQWDGNISAFRETGIELSINCHRLTGCTIEETFAKSTEIINQYSPVCIANYEYINSKVVAINIFIPWFMIEFIRSKS